MAPEADITQAATEPLVEATAGCGDAAVVSSEKITPLPPSASGHEVEVSTATETFGAYNTAGRW